MLNIIIFGGPGSGKGTQSEHIAKKYGLLHISTGEVLRHHIERGTDLGKVADSYISKGMLIPDKLMLKVLAHVLETQKEEAAHGVIFDGFPRTCPQAEQLDVMMAEMGSKISGVVGLEVPDDVLVERMLKRGRETGRADDNERTVKNRIAVFHKQTAPLKDYYSATGRYAAINGEGSVEHIFDEICRYIDSLLAI